MNFTREPIIETIITPKDGYKLVVRNSKGNAQEEYHVDAVEVVSFGHSFFFRSLERPRSFLVPASDYEVVETKETRIVLKNVNIERAIKIGGGRQPQQVKEDIEAVAASADEKTSTGEGKEALVAKPERKRERRRNRRGKRGMAEESHAMPELGARETQQLTVEVVAERGGAADETQVSSSTFSSLFPPPPKLISETIGRYKEKSGESFEGDLLPQSLIEPSEDAVGPVLAEASSDESEWALEPESSSREQRGSRSLPKGRRHKRKESELSPEEEAESDEEEASSREIARHLHSVAEDDDDDYFLI